MDWLSSNNSFQVFKTIEKKIVKHTANSLILYCSYEFIVSRLIYHVKTDNHKSLVICDFNFYINLLTV